MKIALVTTTINVPTVLKLYRAIGHNVEIFVACDWKTPKVAEDFCGELGAYYIGDTDYKCDVLIGHDTISRRNLAILEALKWGAHLIVTIDDDNIPLDNAYFDHFEHVFLSPFNGVQVGGNEWFDVGTLLDPVAPHRGFPIGRAGWGEFSSVTDAKIGVAAGICLGDPDISAVTRIANHPTVHRVSELLRAGIVVDPQTRTVFNSQNTCFLRDFAPAMFLAPGTMRYDDIYASLITQHVMRERDYHVHFGQPFVVQERNQHNLLTDLRAELDGMKHILDLAYRLNSLELKGASVIEDVRLIYTVLRDEDWYPQLGIEAALAWCDDCEQVMG